MLNFRTTDRARARADDLAALERIVEEPRAAASDEVYEHIVFDGVAHQSLMRSAALAKRTVVISSFGKTFTRPAGR